MIIGIDIGGTKANGLLFDPETGAVRRRTLQPSRHRGPELVEMIAAMVSQLRSGDAASVTAVGLGVAGLATRSGVIRYSPNLPGLIEYPLAHEVQRGLDVPVVLSNDATAGAWAEARLGAGRGVDDLVFVALGTGIGSGFVVNGQVVLGANGFAGEAGHMVIDRAGPEHHTGQRGPWEYFASGTALGRMGRDAAAAGRFPAGLAAAGSADAITGLHVFRALEAGDEQAARLLDGFSCEVARGLANLVLILDPSRIIIGGGVVDVGEPLRQGVEQWLSRLLLGAAHRPPVEVVLAELGTDAGALGAGLMAGEATG